MNFKEAIMPNKKKVIFSIIIVIIWGILIFIFNSGSGIMCEMCPVFKECNFDLSVLSPFAKSRCYCGCYPVDRLIKDYVIILLPGIIFYAIYSIIQWISSKK